MATCRKKASEMRARFFPKPTTKKEENVLRVNAKAMQEGNANSLLDAIPGFGVVLPEAESKAGPEKKVEKQQLKTPVDKQEPKKGS